MSGCAELNSRANKSSVADFNVRVIKENASRVNEYIISKTNGFLVHDKGWAYYGVSRSLNSGFFE